MKPFAARYVDFGKVFVPNGALDFSTLAASDAEVGRFGAHLFNRGLLFPETSAFAGQIGAISAALLMFEGGYLFTVVQRRREGELSAAPRTDRPFNQARFVLLSRDDIAAAFASRTALYTGLARAARDPAATVWLTDYTAVAEAQAWAPVLPRLDPQAPSPEAVRFVVNAVMSAAERVAPAAPGTRNAAPASPHMRHPQPISVPLPGHELLERLQLVEAVQYWLLPRLGVLTFALDYVSVQNVHLRLFQLPPDAPAPLPADRVFVPGAAAPRAVEDIYTPLAALPHEALYDAQLPELLALPVAAADAVTLYAVEKQGVALSGPEALRLYPELARLGDRRFNLLRRVPRDAALDLLRQPDLPLDLRLDLLQVAFDAAHGQLALYAPVHLAAPRPARDHERVRALLRDSISRSPETALSIGSADQQIELYRDLLLARREPQSASKGAPSSTALTPLTTGQPVLAALLAWRRGPELAAAFQAAMAADPALFADALVVLDTAAPSTADLSGMLWVWQHAGQGDSKRFTALLERVVQPAWYPALGRAAMVWRDLLAEGRTVALSSSTAESDAANPQEAVSDTGALLRALPRALVPFVWQASLATAERDAVFAEWWLFNEALAVPEQLEPLWAATQKAPPATLDAASPALNYMLGRAGGMSLLQACTPPGHTQPDEALYATVLRAWLADDFHAPAGEMALAEEDVEFLVANLPGSNDILAAVAASPGQRPAIRGLTAASALHWAKTAAGERRQPYRAGSKDLLFQCLVDIPAADEALSWHLLTEDEGSSPASMSWAEYASHLSRIESRLDTGAGPATAPRLRAYLAAARFENRALPDTFVANRLDLRRVLALLAAHPAGPEGAPAPVPAKELLPLAVFHLQETSPTLTARAGELLRAGLRQTDITPHLQTLPDNVLTYLRANFCAGDAALEAAGHWIEAELARRADAYRVERLLRPARAQRAAAQAAPTVTSPAEPAAGPPTQTAPAISSPEMPGARRLPRVPRLSNNPRASAPPPPPPPSGEGAATAAPQPLLGELALPEAAPATRDSAGWLWISIVGIALVILVVLIGALIWIQSLAP